MMTRGALVLAATVCAGPSMAMAPLLPDCSGDLLAPAEAAAGGYVVDIPADGFVSYQRYPVYNHVELVLEHCASRNRLTTSFDLAAGWPPVQGFLGRLAVAFAAEQTYSLRDVAQMALGAGAVSARTHRVFYESCGCRHVAGDSP